MVTSRWLLCVAVTVVYGAPPKEKKKLRNVIITSFGEMPYEPAEGFYQSDVFPVGIDGVLKEQTMDVALRTGILVEDPNEKKDAEEESSPEEDDVTSTNLKRQVSEGIEGEKDVLKGEDEVLLRRSQKRNPKVYNDEEIIMGTRNFGYEFGHQTKKPSMRNYNDNVNQGSSRDIGEGWNLQDAEAILQGRNYNILVQTQGSKSYPMPPPREVPPPAYKPLGGPSVFYPFPQFDYGFPPQRVGPQIVPPKYKTRADNYDRSNFGVQTAGKRQFRDIREQFPSSMDSDSSHRAMRFSVPQTVYYSDYYLRGI